MKPKSTAEILKPFGEYRTPGIQEEVVVLLRRLLNDAENGDIIGCAVATVNRHEECRTYYQPGAGGWARLIGNVAALQHTMLKDWSE